MNASVEAALRALGAEFDQQAERLLRLVREGRLRLDRLPLDTAVAKHLAGRHAQPTHGRRTAARSANEKVAEFQPELDLISEERSSEPVQVYEVHDWGALPPSEGYAFVIHNRTGRVLAAPTSAVVHDEIIHHGAPDTNFDDYTRMRIRQGQVEASTFNTGSADDEDEGLERVYAALDRLARVGLPHNFPVSIRLYNRQTMRTTVKSLSPPLRSAVEKHLPGEHNQERHGLWARDDSRALLGKMIAYYRKLEAETWDPPEGSPAHDDVHYVEAAGLPVAHLGENFTRYEYNHYSVESLHEVRQVLEALSGVAPQVRQELLDQGPRLYIYNHSNSSRAAYQNTLDLIEINTDHGETFGHELAHWLDAKLGGVVGQSGSHQFYASGNQDLQTPAGQLIRAIVREGLAAPSAAAWDARARQEVAWSDNSEEEADVERYQAYLRRPTEVWARLFDQYLYVVSPDYRTMRASRANRRNEMLSIEDENFWLAASDFDRTIRPLMEQLLALPALKGLVAGALGKHLSGQHDQLSHDPTGTPGPAAASQAWGQIEAFEQEHYGRPEEWAHAVTPDTGQALLSAHGDRDSIDFTDEQLRRLRPGAIFTHTHPGADTVSSFSVEDIRFAARYRLGELRVVDSRYRYSLHPQPGQPWPMPETVEGLMRRIINRERPHLQELYDAGKIDTAEYRELISHTVVSAVAERLDLIYTREEHHYAG